MQYKAFSTLILNLTDKVLREVSKEDTSAGIWSKLESLYMVKSLANRLHLKQKLLTFKIANGKSVLEQLEEFGKCLDDLENIDEEINDEDKALMFLNSLPPSYEHFKDAMLLGRDSKISYEEVYSVLKLKEVQKTNSKTPDVLAESLNVKAEFKKNGKKKMQKKPLNDKRGYGKETRSCHYCKKPDHLKKNCWSWRRSKQRKKVERTLLILQRRWRSLRLFAYLRK